MKNFLLIPLFLFSSLAAEARQYIQCADPNSWNRSVINLNGSQSTLFMTNGVHLPDEDRVDALKKLYYENQNTLHVIFSTDEENTKDRVYIPTSVIGSFSNKFSVIYEHQNLSNGYKVQQSFWCFSAIYEDERAN